MAFKLKFRTMFPASVTASSPLTLVKTGLAYVFGLDITELRQSLDSVYLPVDDAFSPPWFDITDYGAIGDGVTVNNAAIAAAVAAAKAQDGGTVYIPPGNFRYNASLDLDDAITVCVRGDSGQFSGGDSASVLTYTGAAAAISLRNAVGCRFENLGIVATEATRILDFRGDGQSSSANSVLNCLIYHSNSGTPSTSRACIDICDNENFCAENTTFANPGMIGIRGVDAGVSDYVVNAHIKSCVFPSVAADTIHIKGPSNSWLIENCSFEAPSTITCIAKGDVAGRSTQVTLLSNWFGDVTSFNSLPLVTTNSNNFVSIGNTYASSTGGGGASICVQMDNSSGSITSIGDYLEADTAFSIGTGNIISILNPNRTYPSITLVSGTPASTGIGNAFYGPTTITGGIDLYPANAARVQASSGSASSTLAVGQSTSRAAYFLWTYNVTASSANLQIGTQGYSNPIFIDGSTVTINDNSNGATSIHNGGVAPTGTGAYVCATSPAITTPAITGNAALTNNASANAQFSVLNNSSGTAASARFFASNGTGTIEFGQRGTAQTAYGILTANRSYCYGATDVAFVADAADFYFGGNGGAQTARLHGTAADLGNMEIVGSFGTRAPATLTGTSGTVTSVQGSVIVNASGAFTITLPAAASYSGHWINIKSIAAQTIASATSNIVPRVGGAAGTALLASGAGNWAKLQSDGTNWVIMSGN